MNTAPRAGISGHKKKGIKTMTTSLTRTAARRIAIRTRGAGMVEYGMLTGLIAVLAIGSVASLGSEGRRIFEIATGALASAQDDSDAVGGSESASTFPPTNPPANTDCYDVANVGNVGQAGWGGCAGMLIVDTAMLQGAGSNGDGSYTIVDGGQTYTFGDSDYNVFTGQVENFGGLFENDTSFNLDIGYWDTSSATNMSYMFYRAAAFNQDIGNWDTGSVTNMRFILSKAQDFNQDLGDWDTSDVTDMHYAFSLAAEFDQDISRWETGNVTDMGGMFRFSSFDQDIGSWDTADVTDMAGMFRSTPFNHDISNWETGNVSDMVAMFVNATAFNHDLSGWCVGPTAPNISNAGWGFDNGATSWTGGAATRPQWGTCPTN